MIVTNLDEALREIRRLRDCIVSARWRLAKGRALWNGPCHECDAALERGLIGSDIRERASDAELLVLNANDLPMILPSYDGTAGC